MAEVSVDCPCGHRFEVRKSLRGGLANCPGCGKAAPVPGGPEPLFWLILGGAVIGLGCVVAFLYVTAGASVAAIVGGIGLLAIIVGVLAS